jgi:hypothetical protein
MIDNISLDVKGIIPSQWLDHSDGGIAFKSKTDNQTGEVETSEGKEHFVTFKIRKSHELNTDYQFDVKGSLHRYHEKGGTNDTDFNYSALCATIDRLQETRHIDPTKAFVKSFEYGINIVLPMPVKMLLDKVVSMPDKPYALMNLESNAKPYGVEFDRTDYAVKVYDKALQCKNDPSKRHKNALVSAGVDNILRVEIKVKKMRFVKDSGIKTLSDLKDKDKLLWLKTSLLDTLSTIIFDDFGLHNTGKFGLTRDAEKRLDMWLNPRFWHGLDWAKRKNEKIYFDKFVSLLIPIERQTKPFLTQLVATKWDDLLSDKALSNSKTTTKQEQKSSENQPKNGETVSQNGENLPPKVKDVNRISPNGEHLETASTFESSISPHGDVKETVNTIESRISPKLETVSISKGRISPLLGTESDGKSRISPKLETVSIMGTIGDGFVGQKVGFHPLLYGENLLYNNNNIFLPKNPKIEKRAKPTACPCCGGSMESKRSQSLFCSERCRKKVNNAKRDRRKAKPQPVAKATPEPVAVTNTPKPQSHHESQTDIQKMLKKLAQNMKI